MSAVLPLFGGVLLGRFVANRGFAIAVQVVLYAAAASILIATAPDHGASRASGAILAAILAPLCVAAVAGGVRWRRHTVAA